MIIPYGTLNLAKGILNYLTMSFANGGHSMNLKLKDIS